ncbi:MAG: acetylornithine carbamoyltransferase [Bacteroidetes bacterium]|nr:acetylornithine carbamoyltransferase [Bacteroidota bacterium]MBS1628590.1 acetylornithine carbamoyltransferase [Bacteroidota bacterium]
MKHFLSVEDADNVDTLLDQAAAYKLAPLKDAALGKGKRLGLLFLNPSLRTRLSTQVAASQLGMQAIVFDVGKEGWALELEDGVVMNGSSVEHIRDAAPVLGSYFDILAVRSFPSLQDAHQDYSEVLFQQLKAHSGVPLLSLESATLHPLQSLSDILTIREAWKENRRPKVVLTWAPHVKPLPQCVANSFAQWMIEWDAADFTITHPEGYALKDSFTQGAQIIYDQEQALHKADFVYVKNWSSYEAYGSTPEVPGDWMLTETKLRQTNQAKVMHCLPVRRNVELSDSVLNSASSLVTAQAANRVWAAQAVLANLLKSIAHKS